MSFKSNFTIPAVAAISFCLIGGTIPAAADILHVPGDFLTIQEAIDAAMDGDEVEVHPGNYNETINFLGKAIRVYSTDGPDVTIIDAQQTGTVVTCDSAEGPDSVLEGFTITGGNANAGGGMRIASSATVINCTFIGNSASSGGGGLRYSANSESSLVLSNCSFIDNEAFSGGGLSISGPNAAVDKCLFDGNTAVQGGGLFLSLGSTGPATLSNLVIRSNIALLGGGMFTIQQAGPTLVNSVFTGNSATLSGGGVYNRVKGFPTLINCTLSGNSSPAGGGIFNSGSSCSVANSIIWGNPGGAILGDIALASYSCIEGGYFGVQIISEDPLFVDPDGDDDKVGTDDDNLRLLAGSPCIDAADNTAVPKGFTTDLDGNPRFVDDPGTKDTGNGKPPIVDMGAYEFQEETPGGCPWDLNEDGSVGVPDLLILLGFWGPCGPVCLGDFDGDDNVGVNDLLILLANWGPCP